MNNIQIKQFLRYPDRGLVEYALSKVNLEEKEEAAIRACGMRGLTQEQAAEDMERSVDAVQRWNREGMRKLAAVWDCVPWIKQIANNDDKPPSGAYFLRKKAETKRNLSMFIERRKSYLHVAGDAHT